jgi:hypothetical protein
MPRKRAALGLGQGVPHDILPCHTDCHRQTQCCLSGPRIFTDEANPRAPYRRAPPIELEDIFFSFKAAKFLSHRVWSSSSVPSSEQFVEARVQRQDWAWGYCGVDDICSAYPVAIGSSQRSGILVEDLFFLVISFCSWSRKVLIRYVANNFFNRSIDICHQIWRKNRFFLNLCPCETSKI